MPFKSKAQQGFMFAEKPQLAKEFAAATPNFKALPPKVGMKTSTPKVKKTKVKTPKAKSFKVKIPKNDSIAATPFKVKSQQPMKVEKMTTPVGMGARGKWVDSVK